MPELSADLRATIAELRPGGRVDGEPGRPDIGDDAPTSSPRSTAVFHVGRGRRLHRRRRRRRRVEHGNDARPAGVRCSGCRWRAPAASKPSFRCTRPPNGPLPRSRSPPGERAGWRRWLTRRRSRPRRRATPPNCRSPGGSLAAAATPRVGSSPAPRSTSSRHCRHPRRAVAVRPIGSGMRRGGDAHRYPLRRQGRRRTRAPQERRGRRRVRHRRRRGGRGRHTATWSTASVTDCAAPSSRLRPRPGWSCSWASIRHPGFGARRPGRRRRHRSRAAQRPRRARSPRSPWRPRPERSTGCASHRSSTATEAATRCRWIRWPTSCAGSAC